MLRRSFLHKLKTLLYPFFLSRKNLVLNLSLVLETYSPMESTKICNEDEEGEDGEPTSGSNWRFNPIWISFEGQLGQLQHPFGSEYLIPLRWMIIQVSLFRRVCKRDLKTRQIQHWVLFFLNQCIGYLFLTTYG